jgi:hypothetical protein
MKPWIILAIAACTLGTALASDLNFKLVNETSLSFEAVYLTPTTDKDWNGNLLNAGKALGAGKSVQVAFDGTAKSATWDLNVVDEDGASVVFKDVNLIDVDTITLRQADGKVTAVVE